MIGHQGEPKTGSFYIQYSTHSTFSAGDESERKRKEKEVEATAPTAPALRAASVGGGARTVVDTDGAGTALAIAALVASIISFGIVLLSFLSK